MDRLAFFWMGEDTQLPAALVQSARLVYGHAIEIFQLTDRATPEIAGTSAVVRGDLPEDIMTARLAAYAMLPSDRMTVYVDADSLVLTPFRLPDIGGADAFLVMRENGMQPVKSGMQQLHGRAIGPFPEFQGKTFSEAMPILAGFVATHRGPALFGGLSRALRALPERLHRWYGDQVVLAQFYRARPEAVSLLPARKFLRVVDSQLGEKDIAKLMSIDTRLITFKGAQTKAMAAPTLAHIGKVLADARRAQAQAR
jgi:hypothetical protein